MNKKEDESNISDALNVIKNAIEDNEINENIKDDVLLLTKMIKKDGTILDLKKSKTDINNYINEHVYGMNWTSPYYGKNPFSGSWCQINVTNCSPPGYISGCPTHSKQQGFIGISKNSPRDILVCSNLKNEGGVNEYMHNNITYE